MNSMQLYFGLTVGLIVMALGAAALLLGPAGWSLMLVGAAIALLTLLSWRTTDAANTTQLQNSMMPAAIRSSAHAAE